MKAEGGWFVRYRHHYQNGMGDKEEEVFTRVTQTNLQQLSILAKSLDFINEEVMTAGIKSRLFKMVLRKLN